MADGEPVLAEDGVDVEEVVRDGADQPVHLTVVEYPHPASRDSKRILHVIRMLQVALSFRDIVLIYEIRDGIECASLAAKWT